MTKLTNITLHGDLGKQIGKKWNLAINSVAEAIHAIEILSGRKLYSYLIDNEKVRYKILINKKETKFPKLDKIEDIRNTELLIQREIKEIDIVPIIEGAGDALDIFTTILGVALIVTGIFAPIGAALSATLITAGIGLTAAGVASMLTKAPTFEPFQEFETGGRPSYLFSGPYNTVREGGPVPIVYGEAITGSQTIAANYKIEYTSSSGSNAITNLKGDLDPDFDILTQQLANNGNVAQSIWNPVIDFTFHPEDDEAIVGHMQISQPNAQSKYYTYEIHILKFRDYSVKISNKSEFRTYYHKLGDPFGNSLEGFAGNKYDYPILQPNRVDGITQDTIVRSMTTDYIGNRIFVSGMFECPYTNTQRIPKYAASNQFVKVKNLLCVDTNGKNSSSFAHPQPNGCVNAVTIQSDGKIWIGGEFTNVVGTARSKIAQLNTDGTLTAVNISSTQHIHSIVTDIIDSTEYVFFAGNGGYLKKYNIDGTEDTTFSGNIPNFSTSHIWKLCIWGGYLVIGGNFSFDVDGITYQCLCRVNKDTGELDPTFNFSFQNGKAYGHHTLLPINYDLGSTDNTVYGYPRTTFNPTVRALDTNTDGNILIVGGFFDSVNNEADITTRNIFAINENGNIEKGFNPKPVSEDSGPDGHIQSIKVRKNLSLSDNKIYISGKFTHYNSPAYTAEEIDVLSTRTVLTPKDRTIYNIARLYGI